MDKNEHNAHAVSPLSITKSLVDAVDPTTSQFRTFGRPHGRGKEVGYESLWALMASRPTEISEALHKIFRIEFTPTRLSLRSSRKFCLKTGLQVHLAVLALCRHQERWEGKVKRVLASTHPTQEIVNIFIFDIVYADLC
jgi:hypothetical protein